MKVALNPSENYRDTAIVADVDIPEEAVRFLARVRSFWGVEKMRILEIFLWLL